MFTVISSYTGTMAKLTAAIVPLLSILFDRMYIPQKSPIMVNTSAQNNEELVAIIMVFCKQGPSS